MGAALPALLEREESPATAADEAALAPSLVEVRTLDGALALLDEWIRAHHRLEAENRRLQWRVDYLETLLRHIDPYLPSWLQDEEARAAEPELYRTIAGEVTHA